MCVDRKREVLCLPLSQHLASFKYLLVLFKLSANLGLDKLLFYIVIKTVLPTEYRNALYRKEDKTQICIPENFAVLVRPAKALKTLMEEMQVREHEWAEQQQERRDAMEENIMTRIIEQNTRSTERLVGMMFEGLRTLLPPAQPGPPPPQYQYPQFNYPVQPHSQL